MTTVINKLPVTNQLCIIKPRFRTGLGKSPEDDQGVPASEIMPHDVPQSLRDAATPDFEVAAFVEADFAEAAAFVEAAFPAVLNFAMQALAAAPAFAAQAAAPFDITY